MLTWYFVSTRKWKYQLKKWKLWLVIKLISTGKGKQISSNWIELNLIKSNWIKRDQIGTSRIKSDETGSNQMKLVQISSYWFLDIQLDKKNWIKLGLIDLPKFGGGPPPLPVLSFVLLKFSFSENLRHPSYGFDVY